MKHLTKSLQVGSDNFWGHKSTVSSTAWQSDEAILFYLTQNSISEIWFGTGVQYRGQVFSISLSHIYFFSHNLSALGNPNPSSFVYLLLQNLLYMCTFNCVWLFCNPWTVCNPLGSSVHGIIQTRILEWVAIPFSRGLSWARHQSHILHWQMDSLPTVTPPTIYWPLLNVP